MSNIERIIEILGNVIVPILVTVITIRFTQTEEKMITKRKMFDNVFLPIFELVEEDLYKKNLTLEEAHQYGESINEIIEKSNGYYHPSLKEYGRKLSNTDNNDYLEQWEYFSEQFDKRYDKISKQLGIPRRNYAYRINNGQYKNNISLIKMLMLNDIATIIFMFSLLLIINVKFAIGFVFLLMIVFLIARIKDLYETFIYK